MCCVANWTEDSICVEIFCPASAPSLSSRNVLHPIMFCKVIFANVRAVFVVGENLTFDENRETRANILTQTVVLNRYVLTDEIRSEKGIPTDNRLGQFGRQVRKYDRVGFQRRTKQVSLR